MTGERLVAIVIHDVAPATWPQCRALLQMLDAFGSGPLTLLVVPHFHRGTHARESRQFVDALNARVAAGDELTLHGYFHVDDGAPPRSPRDFVARRLLTRGEAEFAAIAEREAAARIARGIALFDEQGWPLHGFVPPAWQLNAETRRALDGATHRFAYVPVKSGIYTLPGWRFEATANYCYSPDKPWRRALSRADIACEAALRHRRRVLRLSMHPLDARFPAVVDHWRSLVGAALRTRRPVTKYQAVAATPDSVDLAAA